MPRRFLLVFTITAAVIGAAAWAAPEPAPETLPDAVRARIELAVVIVERFGADGEYLGSASAFFAAPDWLITNLHCVEGVSEAVVNLGELGTFRVTGVIAEDEELDVVVMRTDFPAGLVTPLELGNGPAARRTPVAMMVRDEEGAVTVSPGQVVREVTRGDPGKVITTAPAWLGCSGSPLVDHAGAVVGVVNLLGGDEDNDTALAAPGWRVRALTVGPSTPLREWWAAREVPNGPEGRRYRGYGDAYSLDGDHAKAVEAYGRAAALMPTDRRAATNYADELDKLKRGSEAVAALAAYNRAAPDDADGWKHCGHVHLRADRYAEAEAAYRRSMELRPSADTSYWLGSACYASSALLEAVEAFERALELDPEHGDSLEALESAYAYTRRYEDSCRVLVGRIATMDADLEHAADVGRWFVKNGEAALTLRIADAVASRNRYLANRLREIVMQATPTAAPEAAAPPVAKP